MSDKHKHIREIIRKLISEGLLPEDFYTTTTGNSGAYTYSSPKTPEKPYNFQVDETLPEKAKRFGIPYNNLLDKIAEEDFEIISGILDNFKKTGKMDIIKKGYNKQWHDDYSIYKYLLEVLVKEAKAGNDAAAIIIESAFNAYVNKDLRFNLTQNYNKLRKPDENGKIPGLIDDTNSQEVMNALANMNKLRVVLKLIQNYKPKSDNSNVYFLQYIINRLQLRFFTEYMNEQNRNSKKEAPEKEEKSYYLMNKNFSLSDIQKYLYSGNDANGKNDNFIKFNQANKEIVDALKAQNYNKTYIAIIDGMINSKLDTEEMIEVYPELFEIPGDLKKSKNKVANSFSHITQNVKLTKYLDDVYKKYGLELPPVSNWTSKDIAPAKSNVKLKDDKFGGMFEAIRKIINKQLNN